MSAVTRFLSVVVLTTAFAISPADAATPLGPFEVVAAPRHPAVSNLQAAFRADDPQLVNRLVAFDGPVASFDGSYKSCARATRTVGKAQVGQLIRRIFPDRPNYGKRFVARPADFALTMAPATVVTTIAFRCIEPGGTHGRDWTGAKLFSIGNGRWALSIIQDHLLILKPATGPIRASFDCGKAQSPIDRTICGDRLLAGWDRSVAAAYDQGNGDLAGQRAWLAERDKCGLDKDCLHETMALRTTNLLH